MKYPLFSVIMVVILFGFLGCNSSNQQSTLKLDTVQDSTDIAYSITGLDGPEAVRYDSHQKVYFIANFTGGGNDQDSTGFITKADAKGNIVNLKFMTGTEEIPLHAPRGMYIVDKTLWVADVLGVHGFDRTTGEQTDFIDFTQFEIGFLNDISADSNNRLYVTDTGSSTVYKVENGRPSIFLDDLPSAPNGITLDPVSGNFILAPWGGDQVFYSFNASGELEEFATLEGGNFDGIEFIDTNLFSASQQDSSIRVYNPMQEMILIHTTGRPADIGINTDLKHIAVPYIALDKVEIWELK
ncbi:SMP-30/gluconolactonase/LRE family protein [Gracilimonas sp. Q87]|uniref:SMP-30/gluconolactonase/LRE family protein n=1 Tax=Gracilimonas sp. Q87 TaxID=3384766 RepID=UPI003983E8CA